MVPNADRNETESPGPDEPDLEDVTGYEDGEEFVIREEENPDAWIRSDIVRELHA